MRRLLGLAALVLIAPACATIYVPMYGTHVNRAHAGGSGFGVRVMSGVAFVPPVHGTAAELKDAEGRTINQVPVEGEVVPLPNVDLGITFKKVFDVGYNAHRGGYLIWDVVKSENFSFSLSPAYGQHSDLNPDRVEICDTDEEGQVTDRDNCEEIDTNYFNARYTNANVTALVTGTLKENLWFGAHMYAGLGANAFTVKMQDNRIEEKVSKSDVAPSGLLGLQLKLFIFEANYELGWTRVVQRTGRTDLIRTGSVMAGLRIDYF